MDASTILRTLVEKKNLTEREAFSFLKNVMQDKVTPVQIAATLTALAMKGESAQEITGFVKALRAHMQKVDAKGAIDIVGTGGDGSGTFNISTTATFVVAGAGVKVAKHGNRAASSKCGSADVLEALGVNIQLTPREAKEVFDRVGMVFLFAPLYHPATKQVAAVRKELKMRTVFNILGPLVNPASVQRELLGVTNLAIARKMAAVSMSLPFAHILIVTSEGMDEVSITGKTHVFEIKDRRLKKYTIDPKKYGFKKASRKDLQGADAKQNAEYTRDILAGKKGPKRDTVVLNSACALYASGEARSIKEGIAIAEESIDSGKARRVLERLIEETQKRSSRK